MLGGKKWCTTPEYLVFVSLTKEEAPYAKSKPQKGKVLAVGPGKLLKDGSRKQPNLKVGDVVLFTNWAGDEFKQSHGEDVLLMREEDVLAVVNG